MYTMEIPILYEDDDMLVINKPAGIIVNRADSVKQETIQDWACIHMKTAGVWPASELSEFAKRAGIVHRIDKETSGILLIAKNQESFVELQRQFHDREIQKTYRAIIHGNLVPQTGEINAPIARLPWNRERFGIVPGGKEAVTRYKKLRTFSVEGDQYSDIELYPKTGRTHQIRVHMKYINHPIVGDYLYAGRKTSRSDRIWAPRVMLHASSIIFNHPRTHKALALSAPIPDDMVAAQNV